MIQTTATKSMLKKLEDYVNSFASIDHINKLQYHFLPKFKVFGEQIDEHMREMKDTRECVIKLDQAMNLKASKAQLLVVKEQIQNVYMTKHQWAQIETGHKQTIEKYEDALVEVKDAFGQVQTDLKKKIGEICEQTLKFKLVNYEKVYKDFAKFFHEDELQILLDQKADMSMLDALQASKVSVVQHNSLIAKVEDLNQKLRHLSVLQLEMSTNVIPFKQQKQNFMDT